MECDLASCESWSGAYNVHATWRPLCHPTRKRCEGTWKKEEGIRSVSSLLNLLLIVRFRFNLLL